MSHKTQPVTEVKIGSPDPFEEAPALAPVKKLPIHVGMNVQVFKTIDMVPAAAQVKALKTEDGIKIDIVTYPAAGRIGEHIFGVVRRRPPKIMYGWDFVPSDSSLGVQAFLKEDAELIKEETKKANEEADRRAKAVK